MWRLQRTTIETDAQHTQDIAKRISREVDLVHLCARGARMPTIRGLIGQVSDTKIKEINQRFHGERKGPKTRGTGYYTETVDRRRDSSVIISLYRRLQHAGLREVALYVQLHNMYLREPTASPAYDIDELIRLICAVEMGVLVTDRCLKCGALIVLQSNERHAEKCCFICNLNLASPCRVRGSSTAPIKFPAPEKIQEVIDELVGPLKVAAQLVMCGARPQEVGLFAPGQEAFARKLWPVILGQPAPQGPHPFTSCFYIEKRERRCHAAYIIKTFLRLKNNGLQGGDLFLSLYRCYLSAFSKSSETLHFSRIRGIVHFYLQDEMKLVRCDDCCGSYMILADELPGDQTCPICRMVAHAEKAEPVTVKVQVMATPNQLAVPPLPGASKRLRQEKKHQENPRFSTAI